MVSAMEQYRIQDSKGNGSQDSILRLVVKQNIEPDDLTFSDLHIKIPDGNSRFISEPKSSSEHSKAGTSDERSIQPSQRRRNPSSKRSSARGSITLNGFIPLVFFIYIMIHLFFFSYLTVIENCRTLFFCLIFIRNAIPLYFCEVLQKQNS